MVHATPAHQKVLWDCSDLLVRRDPVDGKQGATTEKSGTPDRPGSSLDQQMPSRSSIDRNLLAILRCPASGQKLEIDGEGLTTIDGSHRYPVVAGIPCLIPPSAKPSHAGYAGLLNENVRLRSEPLQDDAVNSFIDAM